MCSICTAYITIRYVHVMAIHMYICTCVYSVVHTFPAKACMSYVIHAIQQKVYSVNITGVILYGLHERKQFFFARSVLLYHYGINIHVSTCCVHYMYTIQSITTNQFPVGTPPQLSLYINLRFVICM